MILQKNIGCCWSSSVFATDGDQRQTPIWHENQWPVSYQRKKTDEDQQQPMFFCNIIWAIDSSLTENGADKSSRQAPPVDPATNSAVYQKLCVLLARRPHPLQHVQRGQGDIPPGRRHPDVRLQPGQGHFVRRLLSCRFCPAKCFLNNTSWTADLRCIQCHVKQLSSLFVFPTHTKYKQSNWLSLISPRPHCTHTSYISNLTLTLCLYYPPSLHGERQHVQELKRNLILRCDEEIEWWVGEVH